MSPRERPILFSAPMIRALLEGRKSQTRRIMKPQPHWSGSAFGIPGLINGRTGFYANTEKGFAEDVQRSAIKCPYGVPGDRLWVRETFGAINREGDPIRPHEGCGIVYRADIPGRGDPGDTWRPSIFMPRWASRILLEITDVRVQRVQEITEEDAKDEGVDPIKCRVPSHKDAFLALFYDLNKRAPRTENPWVWVISFRRIPCPPR